jgi:hypothetical protein
MRNLATVTTLDSGTYRATFEYHRAERETGAQEGFELTSLTRVGEAEELELDAVCAAEEAVLGVPMSVCALIDLLLEGGEWPADAVPPHVELCDDDLDALALLGAA